MRERPALLRCHDGDIGAAVQAMLFQEIAQQGIQAAADAGDSHSLPREILHGADVRLAVKPILRPEEDDEKILEWSRVLRCIAFIRQGAFPGLRQYLCGT